MIEFAQWLADTEVSNKIREALWIIPVTQCLHILAIGTIVGSALMINLRILNIAGQGQSMTAMSRRFIPWLWSGMAVAFVSGIVMIVGEPVRELVNTAFWAKMFLIFVSLLAAGVFQSTLTRRAAFWERTSEGRHWVQGLAVISLLIWVTIIVLGRWIAYSQIELM